MFYLAALLLIVIAFRVYLLISRQYVYSHSQNLSGKQLPMWRSGRCWWYVTPRDENKWRHGPGAHAEWHIFKQDLTFSLTIDVLADDEDVLLHIRIPWLISLFFGLDHLPLLDRLPYKWRRNYGYQTGVKFFDGALWVHVIHSDMWGTAHGRFHKFLPSWISIATSVGFAEYRGVGFYVVFHFDTLILGRYKHEQKDLWAEPVTAEIPIEPDNSLGFHYLGVFKAERHTSWRSHFPWFKRVHDTVDIQVDNPPMFGGKGENSYDLDDDGIFGMGMPCKTLQEAIDGYREAVYRNRRKYGMPGSVLEAQQRAREF